VVVGSGRCFGYIWRNGDSFGSGGSLVNGYCGGEDESVEEEEEEEEEDDDDDDDDDEQTSSFISLNLRQEPVFMCLARYRAASYLVRYGDYVASNYSD